MKNESSFILFFLEWKDVWKTERSKILKLTIINLLLTILCEIFVREVFNSSFGLDIALFISNTGFSTQGVLNCAYTVCISLLGVPLLFFKSLYKRYFYFFIFGALISILSQFMTYFLLKGFIFFNMKRLIFDLVYLLSIKFICFELFRNPIKSNKSFSVLLFLRGIQDLFQTFLKTSALAYVGLVN